jgi:predicted MFS family arabinose efflux permease
MGGQDSGALVALKDRIAGATEGIACKKAVVLLAALLSLQAADSGAIGALAVPLERSFHIGNAQLGLLITASSLVGALGSLPFGALVDRTNRVRLLVAAVCLWAGAMVATGLASSYGFLLATRLALGILIAVAGPAVASLTGDLFPSAERSRIYGWILTGELVGAGAGLLVAGDIGMIVGWRVTFFLLAAASGALAYFLHRSLPEPGRRKQQLAGPDPTTEKIREEAAHRVDVDESGLLRVDPAKMNLWTASRYLVGIPSNRVLIFSSALGYFFLAGLRTFAVMFAQSHFGLSVSMISFLVVVLGVGAVGGTLWGGRLADRLLGRGQADARMVVAGVGFVAAALLFLPGAISTSIALSMPIFVAASAALCLPNPALDAARLDIVPSGLWGRGESVRTFFRSILESFAPLVFGLVSSLLAGGAVMGTGAGVASDQSSHIPPAVGRGLEYTFLIMLVPLLASGLMLLHQRATYLRDVVTAGESERTGPLRGRRSHRRRDQVGAS